MADRPADVVDKINNCLTHGRTGVFTVSEIAELARFVNRQQEIAGEATAMLNTYVQRREGQISYLMH